MNSLTARLPLKHSTLSLIGVALDVYTIIAGMVLL